MSKEPNLQELADLATRAANPKTWDDSGRSAEKSKWQRASQAALKQLAADVGLGDYKVSFNAGGSASSGDATLHAPGIFVQLSEPSPGMFVLYRTSHRRGAAKGARVDADGPNRWLGATASWASLVRSVRSLLTGPAAPTAAVAPVPAEVVPPGPPPRPALPPPSHPAPPAASAAGPSRSGLSFVSEFRTFLASWPLTPPALLGPLLRIIDDATPSMAATADQLVVRGIRKIVAGAPATWTQTLDDPLAEGPIVAWVLPDTSVARIVRGWAEGVEGYVGEMGWQHGFMSPVVGPLPDVRVVFMQLVAAMTVAPAPVEHPTAPRLTDNQYQLLTRIIEDQYQSGSGRDVIDNPVWSFSVGGAFGTSAGGIIAKAMEAGLVGQSGTGREANVWITSKGYDAWEAHTRARTPDPAPVEEVPTREALSNTLVPRFVHTGRFRQPNKEFGEWVIDENGRQGPGFASAEEALGDWRMAQGTSAASAWWPLSEENSPAIRAFRKAMGHAYTAKELVGEAIQSYAWKTALPGFPEWLGDPAPDRNRWTQAKLLALADWLDENTNRATHPHRDALRIEANRLSPIAPQPPAPHTVAPDLSDVALDGDGARGDESRDDDGPDPERAEEYRIATVALMDVAKKTVSNFLLRHGFWNFQKEPLTWGGDMSRPLTWGFTWKSPSGAGFRVAIRYLEGMDEYAHTSTVFFHPDGAEIVLTDGEVDGLYGDQLLEPHTLFPHGALARVPRRGGVDSGAAFPPKLDTLAPYLHKLLALLEKGGVVEWMRRSGPADKLIVRRTGLMPLAFRWTWLCPAETTKIAQGGPAPRALFICHYTDDGDRIVDTAAVLTITDTGFVAGRMVAFAWGQPGGGDSLFRLWITNLREQGWVDAMQEATTAWRSKTSDGSGSAPSAAAPNPRAALQAGSVIQIVKGLDPGELAEVVEVGEALLRQGPGPQAATIPVRIRVTSGPHLGERALPEDETFTVLSTPARGRGDRQESLVWTSAGSHVGGLESYRSQPVQGWIYRLEQVQDDERIRWWLISRAKDGEYVYLGEEDGQIVERRPGVDFDRIGVPAQGPLLVPGLRMSNAMARHVAETDATRIATTPPAPAQTHTDVGTARAGRDFTRILDSFRKTLGRLERALDGANPDGRIYGGGLALHDLQGDLATLDVTIDAQGAAFVSAMSDDDRLRLERVRNGVAAEERKHLTPAVGLTFATLAEGDLFRFGPGHRYPDDKHLYRKEQDSRGVMAGRKMEIKKSQPFATQWTITPRPNDPVVRVATRSEDPTAPYLSDYVDIGTGARQPGMSAGDASTSGTASFSEATYRNYAAGRRRGTPSVHEAMIMMAPAEYGQQVAMEARYQQELAARGTVDVGKVEADRAARVLDELVALGWRRYGSTVELEISGGTAGGDLNPQGRRVVSIGFAGGQVEARQAEGMEGHTVLARVYNYHQNGAEPRTAREIDAAVRALGVPVAAQGFSADDVRALTERVVAEYAQDSRDHGMKLPSIASIAPMDPDVLESLGRRHGIRVGFSVVMQNRGAVLGRLYSALEKAGQGDTFRVLYHFEDTTPKAVQAPASTEPPAPDPSRDLPHFIVRGGKTFADTNALRASDKISGVSVDHVGFGDFETKTPQGKVAWIRMDSEDGKHNIPGQVGRPHELSGPQLAIDLLVSGWKAQGGTAALPSAEHALATLRRDGVILTVQKAAPDFDVERVIREICTRRAEHGGAMGVLHWITEADHPGVGHDGQLQLRFGDGTYVLYNAPPRAPTQAEAPVDDAAMFVRLKALLKESLA